MIHRNICPICGSENPEGSVVCQVCKANLQNLPDDMFPADPTPVSNGKNTEVPHEDVSPEESNLPVWLKDKLQKTDKAGKSEKVDFESFADAIFGISDSGKPAAAAGKTKQRRPRKTEPVYQPPLGNLIDSPLVEPDNNTADTEPKNFPGIVDFSNIRPVKKWDDPKLDASVAELQKQSDKAFRATAVQVPLWWQQDAPLVETEEDVSDKSAEEDDSVYFNSVSPTKVMDPSEVSEEELPAVTAPSQPENPEEFKPDSGSLLSDLMNEINSNSITLTPAENSVRDNGTVFYTGTEEKPEEPAPAVPEIPSPEDETLSSAEALDQILRGMGYQTEDEIGDNSAVAASENAAAADDDQETKDTQESKTETADSAEAEEADEDPLLSQSRISVKEDLLEEPDIPWDLFGSQDMSLPQSPEDTEYRSFSRRGLPSDQDSTTYQQRMMSSILEKIIYAENFVPSRKKPNDRAVSIPARLFWSLIALGGIILIMMTGITDRIALPEAHETSETQAFLQAVDDVTGNALVVIDYTAAYTAELDAAAEKLIEDLADHAGKVYLSSLNPAAMPIVQQLLTEFKDRVEFAGWWPAGVISIRARLAAGEIPDQVWLVTSESGSVRDWAEQLAVSAEKRSLHVLSSGQLEPLLGSYLLSGLVKSAMSRDQDLISSEENAAPGRTQIAVLYLAALLPLAWLSGIASGFLKSDPNYVRKKNRKPEEIQADTEKEDPNDRRL